MVLHEYKPLFPLPPFLYLMELSDKYNCDKFSLCICAILNLVMLLWVLLLYRYF